MMSLQSIHSLKWYSTSVCVGCCLIGAHDSMKSSLQKTRPNGLRRPEGILHCSIEREQLNAERCFVCFTWGSSKKNDVPTLLRLGNTKTGASCGRCKNRTKE